MTGEKASFAQRRMWLMDQLAGDSSGFLLPLALRITGPLDVPLLERALAGIVARHEVLRTRFIPVDGEPVPRVGAAHEVVLERVEAASDDELFACQLARPLNLATDYPLRLALARRRRDEHLLLIVIHHIAFDGWSWEVLLRELAAGYQRESVAPPALRYADFARGQDEKLKGPRHDRALDYWRKRLAGLTPLALPVDRPRPRFWDSSGGVVRFTLPAELVAHVDRRARQHRATRYMLLLAVYQSLLSHWTSRTDIAVCTTLADRGNAKVMDIIGPLVNTIVVRTDISGQPTFDALLGRVRDGVLADLSHAHVPFDQVVAAVGWARDLSRHPLSQASFTLRNGVRKSFLLPQLTVELVPAPHIGTTMDVFLELDASPDGGIEARLQYAAALFDPGTMRRFSAAYVDLLRAVLDNPGVPVRDLARRLDTPLGTALPDAGGIAGVALMCGDQAVRYDELDGLAGGFATALRAAGVVRSSIVGVLGRRGILHVAAMLAVWRAGGVYAPLDPDLPARRLTLMAEQLGLTCVVSDAEMAELAATLAPAVVRADTVGPDPDGPRRTCDPHDLAYIIFTSGSTGLPKPVGIEHLALTTHVAAARDRYGITADDRVLAFASFSFDASLDQLLPALAAGAQVVVRPDEPWSPTQLAEVVERYRITVVNVPPTYWAELAFSLSRRSAAALSSLRLLILGGEPIPAGALDAWQAAVPWARVCNAYGPTETTITSATYEVGGPVQERVPIGRPLGSRLLYVVDSQGELVADGDIGELLIGGPEVARGYIGQPALTAERFAPDPFGGNGGRLYRTGDLVRWLPSGDLEFVGRRDDQVKIRGFRIELGEVDQVLRSAPGVVAAASAPDAATGQSLIGYVVAGAFDPAALRAWCAERLPHYAVPSEFVALDALPVSASGKLNRGALPDARQRRAASGTAYAAPRTDHEQVIAEVWADVLGIERIGIDDSFFDLGGHSLLAAMAVSRVAERLGRDVKLRSLFENPTIREFGPLVTAARQAADGSIVIADRSGPLPPSFGQEHLWFLDRASDAGDEYLLWFSWRILGCLDRAAWQGALDDMVARHEVLRTALIEVDGNAVQQVRDRAGVHLEWFAVRGEDHGERLTAVRRLAAELASRRFDLTCPPMVRAGVWELGQADQVAVIVFHHVATDGWSRDVFITELAEFYRARVAGMQADLPPLAVQYGDFAAWQRSRAGAGVVERQLDYWEQTLARVPVLELPTDRPRPARWSGRGDTIEVALPPELASRLDLFAREHGATRFMVLLTVVQVVLARWSGQLDIGVGVPAAGRGRPELALVIGYFVNTLVLRTDLSGNPSFAELLRRVRATVLSAFDHQDAPFEQVVERLRPPREASRNPLFSVMVDVQESPTARPEIEGLDVAEFSLPYRTAKFDLTATFALYPGRFAIHVEYATDLFDASTATRFAEHVGVVLTTMLADPDTGIKAVDLLSPVERARITQATRADGASAPPFTVAGEPDAVALVCDGQPVSYAELDGLICGLATSLVEAGMQAQSPVGVCVRRGIWSVAAIAAIWRAGGIYVPLDAQLPAERLKFMIHEANVGCVITDAATSAVIAPLGVPMMLVEQISPAPDMPSRPHGCYPGDLAYIIFTSGSTGQPKAVGVDHGALWAHIAAARDLFEITAEDRVLVFASLAFDASLEQILPALSAGASVVIRPDELWSVDELAARVRAEGITVMELTPSYWAELVDRLDVVAADLASLRLFVTGGEVLPSEPLAIWFTHLPGVPIINTYGPTESVISATAHRIDGPVDGRVPIGRPLGSRRAYVVDNHGALVPAGIPGELLIGGPELARGYLGRPDLTADRFLPDPFGGHGDRVYRTGDVVRLLVSGVLEFVGRCDGQLKIRGFRVEPGEAQAALLRHPGVRAAAVVARELRSEPALVGYVAGSGLEVSSLAAHCRSELPGYLVPSAFVLLDRLPLTVQGKLDTAALPEPDEPASAAFVPPRTPAETVTAQIWAEVLNLALIGVHDDFFALGGHSLRAVAVVSRLKAAFDCPVQVRDVFENPTIEMLAARVESLLIELISGLSDEEISLSLAADYLD